VPNSNNDANVGLEEYTGKNNQQFKFVQVSGDMYLIRTQITNDASCVDAAASGNILQWVSNGGLNQYWIVEFHPDTLDGITSVLERERTASTIATEKDASVYVITPVDLISAEFSAGPNPALKSLGAVNFFRLGRWVVNGELRIYDARGNVVGKVKISDNNTLNSQARRKVGSWDFRDKNGRQVSKGTYLVKGVLKTSDGKVEKVSVVVGVR
jgi:hypothetical protein